MEIMNRNRKLKNIAMSLVAVLMIVCLAAGIVLEFGSGLFAGGDDAQTSSLTAEHKSVTLPEGIKKVSETAEELLARPTGGKDTFVILEIVPSPEYATWGYYIGGKEPYPEVIARAANGGSGNSDNHLVSGGYGTPFRRVENGTKVEYLADETAYANYAANKDSLSQGGYKVLLESVDVANNTGYFEYVGNGRGIYRLTGSPKEEYMAERGGTHTANFNPAIDLYNSNAVAALGYDATSGVVLTDYNYDAVLVYAGQISTGGYFVGNATTAADGEYVIDTDKTCTNLAASSVDDPAYEAGLKNAFNSGDFSRIVFKLYQREDSGASASQRYHLYFDYNANASNPTAMYVVDENTVTFRPGEGKFAAKLTQDGGEYYTEAAPGKGEYSIFMTSFEMTADSNKKGSWVWHAGTLPSGKKYSTKAEYQDGRVGGKLYTPDMDAVLAETTYNGTTAKYKGFYVRNSYVNNEWFKVLCLGIGGYDGTQSTQEMLAILQSEETKKLIRAFDATTTIEIRTKKPGEVTDDDIAAADMIYISNEKTNEDLTNFGLVLGDGSFTPANTGDLATFKMARDIYVSCVNKDIAFMVNANLETTSCQNLKTLYNLFTMFVDPTVMVNFLEVKNDDGTYSPMPNNGLNYIDTATGELVWRYRHNYWCKSGYYSSFAYDGDWHRSTLSLNNEDFNVYEIGGTCGDGYLEKGNSPLFPGWKRSWGGNQYVNQTDGTNRWLIGSWYASGFFQNLAQYKNIYLILRRDTFTLMITNATLNARMESVIYVDEFEEKYNIFYQMNAVAVLAKLPEIKRVQVYYDANGNGLIDDGTPPIWEAVATGETATQGCPVTVTDANALALNYSDPQYFYGGYPVDVKDQFDDGAREKCFIVKVVGRKNSGTDDVPVWLNVEEQKAVSVIIRDMFELN